MKTICSPSLDHHIGQGILESGARLGVQARVAQAAQAYFQGILLFMELPLFWLQNPIVAMTEIIVCKGWASKSHTSRSRPTLQNFL